MNAASASSILKEGSIVNTKIGSNSIWYNNIVYSCDGNMVSLGLVCEYLENLIMSGTRLIIKQTNELYEYLFECTVTDIKTDYPAYISVNVKKVEEIVNTRVFPRYDTYLASDIKSAWEEVPHFCIITNISLGGVAFVTRKTFDYGEECYFSIYLPDRRIIGGKGKVIRRNVKNEFIDYSMQFTDMDEHNSNLLSEHLEALAYEYDKVRSTFLNDIKNLL